MSTESVAETQMLIKFVEKIPFAEEDKKSWLQNLHENGIDDDILAQVKERYQKIPAEKFANDWMRAKNNMELTNIVKKWQMTKASKNFHRAH